MPLWACGGVTPIWLGFGWEQDREEEVAMVVAVFFRH